MMEGTIIAVAILCLATGFVAGIGFMTWVKEEPKEPDKGMQEEFPSYHD